MSIGQEHYSISVKKTAANTKRRLKKNVLTLEETRSLFKDTNLRIVIKDRFGGRSLGEDDIFVFPRYKYRWTILVSPRLGWNNKSLWYGMVVLHLILNCQYRPLQYMATVQEVIREEAERLANLYHINEVIYCSKRAEE